VKYHVGNKPPPKISDSLFGCTFSFLPSCLTLGLNAYNKGLPPLARVKEVELVDKIGLDAVTFLRFNRLLRWLFTGISILTCGVLIPINVTYNLKNVDAKNRDFLSMLTIRDVGGNLLFAHVAVTYFITFLICGLIWFHWKKMLVLRRNWFRSPEYLESFYARTVVITHIPKKLQSDAGIREIYESVRVPYPATSVHINRKVGKLPDLIEFHNNTVRELETYLVKYLKGGRLGKKRPTVKIGATLGLGGKNMDAIDYYTYVVSYVSEVHAQNYPAERNSSVRKPPSKSIGTRLIVERLRTTDLQAWLRFLMLISSQSNWNGSILKVPTSLWLQIRKTSLVFPSSSQAKLLTSFISRYGTICVCRTGK